MVPPNDDLDFGQTIRGFTEGQKVFGRYTLRKVLGRGGMGIVWLAWDEKLEEEIALKFMPEMVRLDDAGIQDLKRETRKSLKLTHANIVRIRDFVEDSNSAAIAMEYVDGPTLSSLRVQQPGHVFAPEQLLPWLRQFIAALIYAHEHESVVHRDLKPANLMLNSRGQLKVADFGISSSVTDSVSRMSMKVGSSGSPPYMSPQQVMGDPPQPSDDIYSLGATIYELVTGKPPFHSGNIYAQIKDKVPVSMTQKKAELGVSEGGEIPTVWDETVARCLAKDPAERPQSARQVLDWLEGREEMPGQGGKEELPPEMPPNPPIGEAPLPEGTEGKAPKSKRKIWGIALAVGVVIAGAAVLFSLSDPGSRPPAGSIAMAINADKHLVFLGEKGEVLRTLSETGQFTSIAEFKEGLARVSQGPEKSEKQGFVNASGNLVIPPKWDAAGDFSEGLAEVRLGDAETGKWGFIDKEGNVVIKPQWGYVLNFSEGLAGFSDLDFGLFSEGKWGFIDNNGRVVIKMQFGAVRSFEDGLASFSKGSFAEGKWGIIDKTGKVLIDPTWGVINPFSEGLAKVSTGVMFAENARWGFIDKSGKTVIEPVWNGALDFSEGLAGVKESNKNSPIGKWGFIDKSGTIVISPKWWEVQSFKEGIAAVMEEVRWGFIDTTGSIIISPKWKDVSDFNNGLSVVRPWPQTFFDEDKTGYGVIDKKGTVLIEPKWSHLVLLPSERD